MAQRTALIVGAGSGISAAFARALFRDGVKLALAARSTDKLATLARETDAALIKADASDPDGVERLLEQADCALGPIDLVLYNASFRVRGPFVGLEAEDVRRTLTVSAFGGFLVGQAAAKRMLPRAQGAIFFTGASASVKGYAQSAPFAMGKFALRGLAQSMARELGPKGIHVAHFVIDGGVASAARTVPADGPADSLLDPDAIAHTYMSVWKQPRSAWSLEVELRPWVERF